MASIAGTPATSSLASGTSHAVNLPASIVAGELLVIVFATAAARTVTPPAGWAVARETYGGSNGGTDRYLGIFTKTASGSEGATATVTLTGSANAAAVSYRVQTWTYTSVSATNEGTSTTPDPASFTSGLGSVATVWIAAMSARGTSVSATPSGYTSAGSPINSNVICGSAYKTTTAASEDPGSWTIGASDVWVAATLAISSTIAAITYPRLERGVRGLMRGVAGGNFS